MITAYFSRMDLAELYKELDRECEEFAHEHGEVTAAQGNLIAARIIEAARNNLLPKAPLAIIEP